MLSEKLNVLFNLKTPQSLLKTFNRLGDVYIVVYAVVYVSGYKIINKKPNK